MIGSRTVKQPEGLICVLLDKDAEYGDRDDAAMDLAAYDEPEAESALIKVACDPEVYEGLADSCGESLGEIWVRRDATDKSIFKKLTPTAARILLGVLEANSPRLANELIAWHDSQNPKSNSEPNLK